MGERLSDEQSESDVTVTKPNESKPAATKPRRPTSLFAKSLLVLLALLGIAAAAYDYWLIQALAQRQQDNLSTKQALHTQLQASQEALTQQQRLTASLQQQLAQIEAQQLALFDADLALKQRLQELSHTDRSDWQLAEIEYMLRLAHQRVVSNSNAKLGLELLLSADELIRELDTAELFAIRKQIAADAMALRNAVDVDIEGLYLDLGALSEAVGALRFNQLVMPEGETSVDAVEESRLARLGQQLASLYRVNSQQEILKPLYTQAEQQALQQQLLLLVSQARQAVLTASEGVYVASLAEAKDIAQRYAIADTNLSVLLDRLEQFSTTAIVPELPDISASHAKMRAYIDSKRERGLVVTDTAEAETE